MLILLMILVFGTLNKVQAVDEEDITTPLMTEAVEPETIPLMPLTGENPAELSDPFVLAVKIGSKYEVACTLTRDTRDFLRTYRCLSAIPPGEKKPSGSDEITLGFGNGGIYGNAYETVFDIKFYENLFSIRVNARPDTDSQFLKPIALSTEINPSDGEYELRVRSYEGGRVVLTTEKIQLVTDDSQCSDIPRRTSSLEQRCFQANDIVGPKFIGGAVLHNGEGWGIITGAKNQRKHFWGTFLTTEELVQFQSPGYHWKRVTDSILKVVATEKFIMSISFFYLSVAAVFILYKRYLAPFFAL